AIDASVEERILVGGGDEAPGAYAVPNPPPLREHGRGTVDRRRVAPRAHRPDAVPAGLGELRLHRVVRRAKGTVGANEPGLPAVEVRLVLQTEEEHGFDGLVARDVAEQLGVDRGL